MPSPPLVRSWVVRLSFESEPSRIRSAFTSSASWFETVVRDVAANDWLRPGLGSWTVRDLVGHTSRNCTFVLELLVPQETTERRFGPFAFWNAVLAGSNEALHAEIAVAAEDAAKELGNHPREAISELVHRTIDLISTSADSAVVRFGSTSELALIDYLPSRIVEFVCHGIDICKAIDRETSDVPNDALAISAELLAAFADPAILVRLLVGRDGSPYNVFER